MFQKQQFKELFTINHGFKMEIWKDIIGTEGFYQISDLGNVKSNISGSWNTLKTRINENGYIVVDILYSNYKKKTMRVHRLLGIHFIDNPNNYKIINHLNGIKTDIRLENLEWCTSSQNNQHAWDNGLYKKKYGGDNKLSKLTWEQADEIRRLKASGTKRKELMKMFNVCESMIDTITGNRHYVRK